MIELAKTELEKIGLAKKADVTDGYVVRRTKAYPVYDDQYETHVGVIRKEIESKYPNLHWSAETACTSTTTGPRHDDQLLS